MHETSLLTPPGHFVSKNDDKEHCFLKQFCFNWAKLIYFSLILREREEKNPNISRLSWSRNGEQFYQTPSIGASQSSRLPEFVPQISQTSSYGASHISRITATHQFVPHPDPGKWYWFVLEFQSLFYKSKWYVRIKFFVWNQHTVWKTENWFFFGQFFLGLAWISRW